MKITTKEIRNIRIEALELSIQINKFNTKHLIEDADMIEHYIINGIDKKDSK